MTEAKYSYELLPEEHNAVFENSKQAIGQLLGFEYVGSAQTFIPTLEQFEDFEEDFEKLWGDDRLPDSRIIAHQLYIGKRVAAQAFYEKLIQNPPAELKKKQYEIEKSNLLCSKNDIEEKFREIFSDEQIQERAFMTSDLFDDRAEMINLERIALRVLFDSGVMNQSEESKIYYDELIVASTEHIKNRYFDLSNGFKTDLLTSFGMQPETIDRQFFEGLPDWIIAAATPIRSEAYDHLFSDAWQKD